MHQEVALPNDLEDRPARIAQLGRNARRERRVLERRTVQRGKCEQVAQTEQLPRLEDVALGESRALRHILGAQLLEEQRPQVRRHGLFDFEPNDFAESTLEHLLFDRREQVFRLFNGQLEIGVARDAEGVPAQHLHTWEKGAEIGADDFFEWHEMIRPPRDGYPTRKTLWDFDPREVILARFRIADLDRQ